MEIEYAKRIKQGDQIALEKLTNANLRFVVSVAKQYQNQGLSLGDLINEGNLGLIKAGQRFDETRGFKFISYAVWWIRQSIIQALAEQSRVVRLPLNRIGDLNRINKAFAVLEQKFQREPTNEELATIIEESVEQINDAKKWNGRQVSVHAPFSLGEEATLLDTLEDESEKSPDSVLISNSLKQEIMRSLSVLKQREADVIIHYYGLSGQAPLLLEEIGIKFGITRERVRQIKEKAIRNLRCHAGSSILRPYL
jgi:RNA polymerase primary sigma factor